ncbi:T9SS type A sorting domain-containing protein [uncultured Kordia sp.]|uniref:T9SS type A sorting domain-containing protein n=1 Tax=uncultured Kordia sp. TaxID=507699 RepID=UPI00260ACD53|nr:T9SS type A sorting domain-containing protein [uncultured Kordia sp.]
MKQKILLLILLLSFSTATFAQSSATAQFASNPETVFNISPNPGVNELNIRLTQKTNAALEVYNLLGRKIYSGKLTTMHNAIDISSWKSGIYLVKVITDKKSITKRFVKK